MCLIEIDSTLLLKELVQLFWGDLRATEERILKDSKNFQVPGKHKPSSKFEKGNPNLMIQR